MIEPPAGDDAWLAMAAQSGDRAAFTQLVTLHKATLYRLARRYVGNGDDAYDVLQDALASAWLALHRFDARCPFGPWVRTILLNRCRDFSRRRAVRRRLIQWLHLETQAEETINVLDRGHDEEPANDRQLADLEMAIAELPARYKEPLLLTAFQGMSQREAALQLGLTTKAVELRVHRARKRLEERLRSSGP